MTQSISEPTSAGQISHTPEKPKTSRNHSLDREKSFQLDGLKQIDHRLVDSPQQSSTKNEGGIHFISESQSAQHEHIREDGSRFRPEERVDGRNPRAKRTSSYHPTQVLDDTARITRNLPLSAPLISLENTIHLGFKISRRTNVELVDGEFLKIIDIVQDTRTAEITLRGWLFRRTRGMNGLLERKLNEICWILHIDEDDQRKASVQGMESIPIANVVRRRHIRMTNLPFPELSWREDPREPEAIIFRDRVLVCRFKYVCSYADANARERNNWCEKALHRLRTSECDHLCSKEDEEIRSSWRGETVKGGSSKSLLAGEAEFLEQERQCYRSIQDLTIPLISRRSRSSNGLVPSSMRHGSVGSLIGELDMLKTSDVAEDESEDVELQLITSQEFQNRNIPRNSSVQIIEAGPKMSSNPASVNQKARNFNKEKSQPKNFIDLTIDDGPSTRTNNKAKVGCDSFPSSEERAPLEVADIPPPTGLKHRYQICQRKGPDQRNLPQSSYQTRPKRSMDQVQLISHHPRKRINVSCDSRNFNPNSSCHDLVPPLRSEGQLTNPEDSDRNFGRSGSSTSVEELGVKNCSSNRTAKSPIFLRPPTSVDLTIDSVFSEDKYAPGSPVKYPEPPSRLPGGRRSPGRGTFSLDESKSLETQLDESKPAFPPPNSATTHKSLAAPLLEAGYAEPTNPSDRQQRYTFGDCFCGAGGTSRGAIGAGLRVEWGFDFTLAACKSYALNFYAARVYNIWAHQFSSLQNQDHKVDICHLSPPCQFFSDAHTVLGKDDDMNIASLFAIFELLQQAKPRVVTLEQTSGLLRRHPVFLNAVILMFTSRGFSIRWRLLNCADFGLPQRRLRVFMIASW